MKYELETIPVWDAYEKESPCPLCYLEAKAEDQYLSFYLGNSVMAPEMRVEVNETGFCRPHFHALLTRTGKLGLALMTSTHMAALREVITKQKKSLSSGLRHRLFKMQREGSVSAFADEMERKNRECLVCRRLGNTVKNYYFTIVHLYKTNTDFFPVFQKSRGVCLDHLPGLMRMAEDRLRSDSLQNFIADLLMLEEQDMAELEARLDEFTQKFDYRSERRAMKENIKRSVPESIAKISGRSPFADKSNGS